MFEGLRSFVAELIGSPGERPFAEDDYRMAAAAILIHVADADGAFDWRERARLRTILKERFGLPDEDAGRMIAQALLSEHEAVDLDRFVSIVRRALDAQGRIRLVEMMWDIAYADGPPLEVEESAVWRVGQMLGLPPADLAALDAGVRRPGSAS